MKIKFLRFYSGKKVITGTIDEEGDMGEIVEFQVKNIVSYDELTENEKEKLYQSTIVKLGNNPYVLVIAQDITEIKKAEKLIEEELIKLKELDDIKNELNTRASHELKTPLTSILGSAELFLNLYKGVYTDEMKQLIEIIYKGGKRLENLVKNTIDISPMESKSISFRREKEDIGKLINECADDLIYLADKRELSLELNVQKFLY